MALPWISERQNLVALSTCEAEHHALTEASKDFVEFHKILEDLGVNIEGKFPKNRSDDMSAKNLAMGEKPSKKWQSTSTQTFTLFENWFIMRKSTSLMCLRRKY